MAGSSHHGSFFLPSQNLHTVYVIITVYAGRRGDGFENNYPIFHLSMECFICKVEKGDLTLLEHEAKKWLSFDELDDVDWLPADLLVVTALRKYMRKRGAEK